MKNKSLLHNDEIDLVSLIKTIYNELSINKKNW